MSVNREAWLATAGRDLPLDAAALCPEGDGFLERRRAARRARWISRLRPVLQKLEPGEVVRHVALGVRYRFAEFYFSAYLVAHHANLTALVLTDRRLLLVACKTNGTPRDVKNQIRLEQLREVKPRRVFGGLHLVLADGQKPFFTSVPRADAKRLAELAASRPTAPALAPAGGAPGSSSQEALCPACLALVPGKVGSAAACSNPACRIPFRSPQRAARLSALVPGVGDIYLRHHAFGAFEFVGSVILLCVAAFLLAEAVDDGGAVLVGIVLAFFVLIPRVVDYLLTLHMGRKGYVPLADRPAPGGDARNLAAFPGWALALFAAGALAVGGSAVAAVGRATDRAALREAMAAAEADRLDEALAAFHRAEAKDVVATNDRGRFGLALLRTGHLAEAEEVLAPLAGVPSEEVLAKEIDAEYARYPDAETEEETEAPAAR